MWSLVILGHVEWGPHGITAREAFGSVAQVDSQVAAAGPASKICRRIVEHALNECSQRIPMAEIFRHYLASL
eukprot:scaffold193889_cov30-Tisochrysis_lutea.AAC.2